MANAVITVKEADGVTETDVTVLDVGRQAAAASKSVALSTEDKAQLDAAVTALQLIDNLNALIGDTALASSDSALAVRIHPDGVNANGQAAAAASAPVVEASDSLLVTSIKVDDAAFTPGTTPVQMIGFQADETATDSVDEGDAGAPRMTLDRKVITTLQPHTAGGLSAIYFLDIDESPTSQEVKATAGCLYKLRITNRATTVRYVRLYNLAAANVTVGTSTLLDVIPVPGAASADVATVITENFGGVGLTFSTALTLAATTGFADNDTGAPGANDVIVSAYYK